jgi:(R)-2-hydroxyacyl-CoA dehydratese activating ATPase
MSLARRVNIEPQITMTGGVAKNTGMVAALEQVLGQKMQVNDDAQFIGAVGAALFALEKMDQSFESSVWRGEHAVSGGH